MCYLSVSGRSFASCTWTTSVPWRKGSSVSVPGNIEILERKTTFRIRLKALRAYNTAIVQCKQTHFTKLVISEVFSNTICFVTVCNTLKYSYKVVFLFNLFSGSHCRLKSLIITERKDLLMKERKNITFKIILCSGCPKWKDGN